MHVALQQDVAPSELPSQQSQPSARDLRRVDPIRVVGNRRSSYRRHRVAGDRRFLHGHPTTLHAAICTRERAEGILDRTVIHHHQPAHHRGLGGRVRSDDGRRRGSALRGSHPALDRRRGVGRRFRRRGVVLAMVCGVGAAPRPRCGRGRRRIMRTRPGSRPAPYARPRARNGPARSSRAMSRYPR